MNGFLLNIPNQTVTIGNITYSLNTTNNTASVINVKNNTSNLTIPGVIQCNNSFYNVTSVANGACFNKNITSLVLSNNIISIGADAFANNLLTSLTLPPYLTSLGNNAFSNNPFAAGTVINLPSNCT
ncbi:leucine-rich repeat protein [bacterium]|nr:leucine-rich repeat protein [bacterium]